MAAIEKQLDERYQVHRLFEASDERAFVASVGKRIRGIATGGGSGVKAAIMDSLPALEIIAINGIGTDAVDLTKANARGIRVTTTPDVLTDDVADLGMALLLATARLPLCAGDRFVRDGRWARTAKACRSPARLAASDSAFSAWDGLVVPSPAARPASLSTLPIPISGRSTTSTIRSSLRWKDGGAIGFPDCRRGRRTVAGRDRKRGVRRPRIGRHPRQCGARQRRRRAAIGGGPGRGRQLGGPGLDVFVDEPNVPEELFELDTVVLQPHRASATVDTRIGMGELVLANLAAHFAGQPLRTPVG